MVGGGISFALAIDAAFNENLNAPVLRWWSFES